MRTAPPPGLNAPNRARSIAVVLSWCTWAFALWVAFMARAPQVVVIGLMALGLVPYLVAIHLVEPWLLKRKSMEPTSNAAEPGINATLENQDLIDAHRLC